MNMPNQDPALKRPSAVSLEVRDRIEDFLVHAAHIIDDDQLEAWPGLFAANAEYEITTRENLEKNRPIGIMYCDSRGMLEDRILAMRTANIFEKHTYCHILGRPQITDEGGQRYAVRSNFTVHRTMYTGSTELFSLGRYVDLISLESGEPVFLKRQVVLDPRSLDTLLVIPL
jgi:3-phenylpropionate/cinnamic acid dioxygenase small subunit